MDITWRGLRAHGNGEAPKGARERVGSCARHESVVVALGVAGLTLFSLLVQPGYRVLASDQALYMPAVYQRLDPTLLSRDFVLTFNQSAGTLFDEMLAGLWRFTRLDVFSLLLLLTALSRLLYFWALYRIALFLTGERLLSFLAGALFLSAAPVYGTGTSLLSGEVLPRSFGLALGLGATALLVERRTLWATLPLGLGLLLHSVTMLPFVVVFIAELVSRFLRREIGKGDTVLAGASVGGWTLLFLLVMPLGQGSIFERLDPAWEAVVRSRDPYVFLASWVSAYPSAFFYLAVTAALFFISWRLLPDVVAYPAKRRFLLLWFWVPVGFTLVSFVGADIARLSVFAQAQLTRALLLWKIVVPFMVAWLAWRHVTTRPDDIPGTFTLLGILAAFVFREALLVVFVPLLVIHAFVRNEFWRRRGIVLALGGLTALLGWYWFLKGEESALWHGFGIPALAGAAAFLLSQGAHARYGKALIGGVFLLWTVAAGPQFHFFPDYYRDNDFLEACEWIRDHTPHDALFVTEPFSHKSTALRLGCFRSVFATHKDGAQVVFDRRYAFAWAKRIALLERTKAEPEILRDLARDYGVEYVFSEETLPISELLAFQNTRYKVYQLP